MHFQRYAPPYSAPHFLIIIRERPSIGLFSERIRGKKRDPEGGKGVPNDFKNIALQPRNPLLKDAQWMKVCHLRGSFRGHFRGDLRGKNDVF